jgi:hypothetical protein
MHIEVESARQEETDGKISTGSNSYRGKRAKTYGKGSIVKNSPTNQLFNKKFKSPISFKNGGTMTGSTESGIGAYNLMSSKQYQNGFLTTHKSFEGKSGMQGLLGKSPVGTNSYANKLRTTEKKPFINRQDIIQDIGDEGLPIVTAVSYLPTEHQLSNLRFDITRNMQRRKNDMQ